MLLAACGGGGGAGLALGNALQGPSAGDWDVVVFIPTRREAQVTGLAISPDPFSAIALSVGDSSINTAVRTLLQFDISDLTLATADEAHLYIATREQTGDPFNDLGGVYVDHILAEDTLVPAMYSSATLTEAVAHLTGLEDEYSIDVTDMVRADLLAGRTTSTFRLRTVVLTDFDGRYDQYRFWSSQAHDPALRPSLRVVDQ